MENANAHEMYPNLWLGDIKAATNEEFLDKYKINCIFNCTQTLPFSSFKNINHRYRLPVKDNLEAEQIYKLYLSLDKTIELIYLHLRDGDRVLVHCHAGRQRSVAVLIAFLMKYGDMSLHESLSVIQSKRSCAGTPQLNFAHALAHYEKHLEEMKMEIASDEQTSSEQNFSE